MNGVAKRWSSTLINFYNFFALFLRLLFSSVQFILLMEARICTVCWVFLYYLVRHFLLLLKMSFSAKIHACRSPLSRSSSKQHCRTFIIFRVFKSPLFPTLPPLWPPQYYSPRLKSQWHKYPKPNYWTLLNTPAPNQESPQSANQCMIQTTLSDTGLSLKELIEKILGF